MGLLIGVGNTKPMFPYDYFYGIEWDTAVASPECKRVGKAELHASLPVQSQMRRCILNDDGKVVYYLHPNDSTKRDTGADAKLDGSDGQVMVELPEYYYRCEMEGTKRRYLMSTHKMPGFNYVPKMYVSAYQATLERVTRKLASVVNKSVEYRGGNNQADWDGTYRSQLGMPVTACALVNGRAYARNRGSMNWNCFTYDAVKTIFWFFSVEYASFHCQDEFNASPTLEGYKQGGLGKGVTTLTTDIWKEFNSAFPIIPCGTTNILGNLSGVVTFYVPDEHNENGFVMDVPSYRGIENPYGHIAIYTDGCKVNMESDEEGGKSRVYVCDNPSNYNPMTNDGYKFVGELPRERAYVKEIFFGSTGDIFPLSLGGSSTTYFATHLANSLPQTGIVDRVLLWGGSANHGSYVGIARIELSYTDAGTTSAGGHRLTYYPEI